MISVPMQTCGSLPTATLPCVCCGQRLSDGDAYCDVCQAPAALSQTAAARAGSQNFLSVLGASNSGKTVYLGLLLDILSKGSEAFHGTASGAFSIELQEQVVTALERRSFPQKTPSEADLWKWLHCQISMTEKKKSRYIDLISPDFAGEAIALEVAQAGLYPAIELVVSKSKGLMILCDSMRVRDAGSGEDLFAMKLASYIAQLHGLASDRMRRRDAPVGPAVAIVFTKCDGCPEAIDDPAAFAANNTPRLFEYCTRTFTRHAFFAASVAGSSGAIADAQGYQAKVPFHTQPHGIVEPLQWMLGETATISP
jgi:hypothetical protein